MRSGIEHLEAAVRLAEREAVVYEGMGVRLRLVPELATVVDWEAVDYRDYESDENDDPSKITAIYAVDGDVVYRIPAVVPASGVGLGLAVAVWALIGAVLLVWRLA